VFACVRACVCVCAFVRARVDILKGSSNEHCGRAGNGILQTADLHRSKCREQSTSHRDLTTCIFRRQILGKRINTKQGCAEKWLLLRAF
jgi:hypothetical protein